MTLVFITVCTGNIVGKGENVFYPIKDQCHHFSYIENVWNFFDFRPV